MGNFARGLGVDLDEDALPWAQICSLDDRSDQAGRNKRQGTGPSRVIERLTGLGHVGDPVLQQDKDIRAVVDAQTVPGAQVLIDPHPHADTVPVVAMAPS